MNKILLSCVILCAGLAVQAQQTFTIKGKFSELKAPQKIALRYGTGKKLMMDTTTVINGAFSFSGKVQYPVRASLYLIPPGLGKPEDVKEGTQDFFVEQGKITVSGKKNMKDALIQGGKTQREYLPLLKQLKPLQDQLDKTQMKWAQLSSQKLAAAKKKFGPELTYEQTKEAGAAAEKEMPPGLSLSELRAKIAKVEHDFVWQHPDSYVSFDLVRSFMNSNIDAKSFNSLYNSLSQRLLDIEEARIWPFRFLRYRLNALNLDQLKSTYAHLDGKYKSTFVVAEAGEIVNMILQKIKAQEAAAIGAPAIPIKKVDINGNPVNWDSFKGKYLLLDFWSTYCGSCRAAHPHLKALYAKYKDKGFEILGISDEESSSSLEHREKLWKSAIKKDGLTWPQVLNDIDKEKFDAFKAYGTSYAKILLDKEGKIIDRYTGFGAEAELDKKLKEVFGF